MQRKSVSSAMLRSAPARATNCGGNAAFPSSFDLCRIDDRQDGHEFTPAAPEKVAKALEHGGEGSRRLSRRDRRRIDREEANGAISQHAGRAASDDGDQRRLDVRDASDDERAASDEATDQDRRTEREIGLLVVRQQMRGRRRQGNWVH